MASADRLRGVRLVGRVDGNLIGSAIPFVLALVVIGPGLGPGSLFNLDLIAVPQLDIPRGFWGLGPELPRRTPFWVPIAWASGVVPATLAVKVVMIAVFVSAWCGMRRWAASLGVRWAACAGALYAFSPFVLTRTAVGHMMITVPLAILPWVMPTLLRPGRRLGRTYLAAVALGLSGHFGGSLAILVMVASLARGRNERWGWALLVVLVAQAPWLVPGLLVAVPGGADIATGAAFTSNFASPLDVLGLSAGSGFWNSYYQVGGGGVLMVVLGAVLLGLGLVGTRHLPDGVRGPLVVLGAFGWLLPALGGLRPLESVMDAITSTMTGGVWRESQRVLVVHLLWLAPAAMLGAQHLVERCTQRERTWWMSGPISLCVPVVTVVLAVPGVWGIGGQLDAVAIPSGWEDARRVVRAEPGTVLALPWYQYYNQRYDDGRVRRVLSPLPLYFGGDVLASSDNGLEADVRERGDPREETAAKAVSTMVEGADPLSVGLEGLGVRWVALHSTLEISDYSALSLDPGLREVIRTPDIVLFEVVSWRSAFVTPNGEAVTSTRFGEFAAVVDGDAGDVVVWNHPAGPGWRIGGVAADSTSDGLVLFERSDGVVWNMATPPAVLSAVATVIAAIVVAGRDRRRRRNIDGLAFTVSS